ncbi:hypothetical protein SNEBB_004650 [Seison nebaliae]|nr:hypothetical protein SNEBB_004650 [Seison nebaliae]
MVETEAKIDKAYQQEMQQQGELLKRYPDLHKPEQSSKFFARRACGESKAYFDSGEFYGNPKQKGLSHPHAMERKDTSTSNMKHDKAQTVQLPLTKKTT